MTVHNSTLSKRKKVRTASLEIVSSCKHTGTNIRKTKNSLDLTEDRNNDKLQMKPTSKQLIENCDSKKMSSLQAIQVDKLSKPTSKQLLSHDSLKKTDDKLVDTASKIQEKTTCKQLLNNNFPKNTDDKKADPVENFEMNPTSKHILKKENLKKTSGIQSRLVNNLQMKPTSKEVLKTDNRTNTNDKRARLANNLQMKPKKTNGIAARIDNHLQMKSTSKQSLTNGYLKKPDDQKVGISNICQIKPISKQLLKNDYIPKTGGKKDFNKEAEVKPCNPPMNEIFRFFSMPGIEDVSRHTRLQTRIISEQAGLTRAQATKAMDLDIKRAMLAIEQARKSKRKITN